MSISIQAIVRGIKYKLSPKQRSSRFPAISWLQEKKLKHQDDVQLKEIQIGNLSFRYRRPYEILHTYKELFEEEIYKFPSQSQSPLIVDCGANIGLSVLYFKSLYPQSSIIAFEPDQDNFLLLNENCKRNSLTNVDCRQSAVWISDEIIHFSSDGTQGSQIASEKATENVILVKAERLADLLDQKMIDFLKIDIEGAEVDVLTDCSEGLKNVRNLFVEYHGKAEDTEKLSALLSILKEHYKVYIKMAADNLGHPFVLKKTGSSFDVQLNIFCYR